MLREDRSPQHAMGTMPGLRPIEMNLVDELFGMSSGWVLDFSNATFSEFFREEVGVNIDDAAYEMGSNSKGKRLRAFLLRAQTPAIAKALAALWEYREDMMRRSSRAETVPDGRQRLSKLIVRLGGGALPTPFDNSSESNVVLVPRSNIPTASDLQTTLDEFIALHSLDPQTRGYAFEKFLTRYFNLWGLEARGGFRNTGEQIDGSFLHEGSPFLLEAKWQNEPTNASVLHSFQGKCSERPDWSRGLFISYNGFSRDAFAAFTPRRIVLVDGNDIYVALSRTIPLGTLITEKMRHATDRKTAFVTLQELFPE